MLRHDVLSKWWGHRSVSAATASSTGVEPLEIRRLMAAGVPSIDGTGNNLANSDWGSAGAALLREAPAAYADGASAPSGEDRPSAREISNAISAALAEGE